MNIYMLVMLVGSNGFHISRHQSHQTPWIPRRVLQWQQCLASPMTSILGNTAMATAVEAGRQWLVPKMLRALRSDHVSRGYIHRGVFFWIFRMGAATHQTVPCFLPWFNNTQGTTNIQLECRWKTGCDPQPANHMVCCTSQGKVMWFPTTFACHLMRSGLSSNFVAICGQGCKVQSCCYANIVE